jgi:hypothetical protein
MSGNGLISLIVLQNFGAWKAGEQAGFAPEAAKRLVESKYAKYANRGAKKEAKEVQVAVDEAEAEAKAQELPAENKAVESAPTKKRGRLSTLLSGGD